MIINGRVGPRMKHWWNAALIGHSSKDFQHRTMKSCFYWEMKNWSWKSDQKSHDICLWGGAACHTLWQDFDICPVAQVTPTMLKPAAVLSATNVQHSTIEREA